MGTRERPKWELHEAAPSPDKKLATKAPRYGPAAVLPRIASPPHGKLDPDAPKELPIHALDREHDTIVELCFVQRSIGAE